MTPLLLFLSLGLAHAGPCEDLAARVDPIRLEDDVRALAGGDDVDGAPIVSRHVEHADHARAEAWLWERLDALDLAPRAETFEPAGLPDGRNLLGALPGTTAAVYLSAHYDSTGSGDAAWDPATDEAPGADDNASGVAAVLEAARLLRSWDPGFEYTVRVALFDTEEHGLLGSWHHVDGLEEGAVRGVFNVDPLGFNAGGANNLWSTFDPRFEDLAVSVQDSGETLSTPLDITTVNADLIGGDARSDHYPFWAAGFPAVHISSFPQPPEYHTPLDRPELVDLAFLESATAVLVHAACVAAEPLPEPPPAPPQEDSGSACTGCAAAGTIPPMFGVCLVGLVTGTRRRRQ